MIDHQPNKLKDRSVMFMSASQIKDAVVLLNNGMRDILISYHYIRKRKKFVENEVLPRIRDEGGYFMTDSGGFTILNSDIRKLGNSAYTAEHWKPYLEEYVGWLNDWKDYIYVAANMDLDNVVGRDVVDRWNHDYFTPLKDKMNVVFVTQKDTQKRYFDDNGHKRLREYMRQHEYVGVNRNWRNDRDLLHVVRESKHHKVRIHGFAITSIPSLKKFPLFSADSTSWLFGDSFGITFQYDGKNFRTLSKEKKYARKVRRADWAELGIDVHAAMNDNVPNLHAQNIWAWKGGRHEYLKIANLKLWNKPISFYDKRVLL